VIEFWVSLVRVRHKGDDEKVFDTNFTHVKGDYYIFEGDVDYVMETDGVVLEVLEEGAVPGLGDLNETELVNICDEYLGVKL